jgi:hypothetical protein
MDRRHWQALTLNLVAPGLGQFRLRRWGVGLACLAVTLAGFAWAAWETLSPLAENLRQLLGDGPDEPLRTIRLAHVGIGVLAGFAAWGWSFLDVMTHAPSRGQPSRHQGQGMEAVGEGDDMAGQ